MKYWHKIVIILLVALVLITGVLAVVLKSRLVPETIEDVLIARLATVIKQPVSFSALEVGLWGTITIKDITIGETIHKQPPLFYCPHVLLHCRLLPLLSKEIVIEKVTLYRPEVFLEKNVRGYFAFMDGGISAKETDIPEKNDSVDMPDPSPLSFVLNRLSVEDGSLAVKETSETSTPAFKRVLSQLDLTLSDFSLVSPFSLVLATGVPSFPSSRVQVNAIVDPSSNRVTSSLEIQSDPKDECTMQVNSTIEMKDNSLLIEPLDVISEESIISVKGNLQNFSSGQLTGQLYVTSPAVVMDKIISCLRTVVDEGEMDQEEEQEENGFEESGISGLFPFEGAAIDADLSLESISYANIRLTDVKATCNLYNKTIDLKSFRGTIGEGLLSGNCRASPNSEGIDYSLHLTGSDVQLDTVVKAVSSDIQGNFQGLTDFTVNLSGSGTTQESFKKNLKGEGDFLIKDGSISDIQFLKSMASFIQIDKLDTLTFDRSYGTFNLADELIHTTSNLTGPEIELFPEGTVSLDAYVNLSLKMRISPSLSEQIVDGVLTKYFIDEKGWAVIDLSIKGPSDEVVVMPASSTINNISEMLVDILLKKEEGENTERENKKEALEELLEKLMKRSSENELVQEGSASDVQ
ncbi:MAG: AsmA family protein [Thermodesulfobacteriota bacterium]|nr:AsmA family protein [Thermodesulfobacteriota bacterium]